MAQSTDETDPRPRCSVSLVKASKRHLHAVELLGLRKPGRQAGSQVLLREGWQRAEIEINGVTPIGEMELSQCSASLETEGL